MIYIFVLSAFILAWFFIEITLFLANKDFIDVNEAKIIPYSKFIWNFRILAVLLLFSTFVYMYNFQNEMFLNAIKYCLGIIK